MTARAKPRSRPAAGARNSAGAPARNGTHPTPRVPYDENAEAALLGAALLKPSALEILATRTRPDDFYTPAHQHIAAALTVAHTEGWEANPVTIHAELTRQGLGELVPGHLLITIQTGTPSTSGAGRYADIVAAKAHERRLHAVGRDLADAIEAGDTGLRQAVLERLADLTATGGGPEILVEDIAAALAADTANEPTILTRADGKALLYAASVNVIQSEPGQTKTWLALLTTIQVIGSGGTVVYLDYEDSVRRIVGRLLTLGANPESLVARFRYISPSALTAGGAAAIRRLVETENADLVVIDAVADSVAAQGLDENAASDVLMWWELLPKPLAATGACVLLLDHVTKSKETRGRWSRGSGAKLGAVDGACYSLEPIEALSRQRVGKSRLVVSKDRHGYIGAERTIACVVELRPHNDGDTITYDLDATDLDTAAWAGPTDCMALVRQLFTEHPDSEYSRSAVDTQLKANYGSTFRRDTINEALERLALTGDLLVRTGPRNGRFYRLSADAETASRLDFEPEEDF